MSGSVASGAVVRCVARGYACRYAAWVLERCGATVEMLWPEDADATTVDRWPVLPRSVPRTELTGGGLDQVDVLLTDSPALLDLDVTGSWPETMRRLAVVELLPPAGELDANARIASHSGIGAVIGEADGPGREPPGRMLEALVGVHAAIAALAATLATERDGVGEHVRIDPVACMAGLSGVNAIQFLNYGLRWIRSGASASGSGGPFPFRLFPCADGWIVVICRSREEWEGFLDMLGRPAWSQDTRFADPLEIAAEHADEVAELVSQRTSQVSTATMVAAAGAHRVPLAEIRSPGEVVADSRLFADGDPEQPVWPITRVPGGTGTPPWLRGKGDCPPSDGDGPLAGLRVLDLGWVWAAPIAGAWLADLGADVVKVESLARLDVARRRGVEFPAASPLYPPALPGYEQAWVFNAINRNKRSIQMELKDPADRKRFLELVAHADVIIESFTDGVLELGFRTSRRAFSGIYGVGL